MSMTDGRAAQTTRMPATASRQVLPGLGRQREGRTRLSRTLHKTSGWIAHRCFLGSEPSRGTSERFLARRCAHAAPPPATVAAVLEGGAVLEKAAANISVVAGVLSPERAKAMSSRGREAIDPAGGQAYSAAAMSLVFHSAHPHIPTLRADVRLFEVGTRPLGRCRGLRAAPGGVSSGRRACGALLLGCSPGCLLPRQPRTHARTRTHHHHHRRRHTLHGACRWRARCGTAAAATSPPSTRTRPTLQSSTPTGGACATSMTPR